MSNLASSRFVCIAGALGLGATGMAGDDGVIARYEGGQVTVKDLESAILNKDKVSRVRLATLEGRRGLLREMENYDLLVREAERRGYAKHPRVLDAARSAAVDALLAAEVRAGPASSAAEARDAFVKRLFDRYAPEVHPELVDAVKIQPAKVPDQPRGFRAAPADPRAPTPTVAPDGI